MSIARHSDVMFPQFNPYARTLQISLYGQARGAKFVGRNVMTWIIPPRNIIETTPAPVIWVDGIGAVAIADGVVSTYYVSHRDPLYGNCTETMLELILKRTCLSVVQSMDQGSTIMEYLLRDVARPLPGCRPTLVR